MPRFATPAPHVRVVLFGLATLLPFDGTAACRDAVAFVIAIVGRPDVGRRLVFANVVARLVFLAVVARLVFRSVVTRLVLVAVVGRLVLVNVVGRLVVGCLVVGRLVVGRRVVGRRVVGRLVGRRVGRLVVGGRLVRVEGWGVGGGHNGGTCPVSYPVIGVGPQVSTLGLMSTEYTRVASGANRPFGRRVS